MRRLVLLLCIAVAPAAVAKPPTEHHRTRLPASVEHGTSFREATHGTHYKRPVGKPPMNAPPGYAKMAMAHKGSYYNRYDDDRPGRATRPHVTMAPNAKAKKVVVAAASHPKKSPAIAVHPKRRP